MKVTPGHSFQDYEVARRHNLPILEIFDDRGWITGNDVIEVRPDLPKVFRCWTAQKIMIKNPADSAGASGS